MGLTGYDGFIGGVLHENIDLVELFAPLAYCGCVEGFIEAGNPRPVKVGLTPRGAAIGAIPLLVAVVPMCSGVAVSAGSICFSHHSGGKTGPSSWPSGSVPPSKLYDAATGRDVG